MSNKKNDILLDLALCKASFDKVNIPWVVTGGTVLGYARYKDIVLGDDDLDIGVFVELSNDEWGSLYNSFHTNGFKFSRDKSDFMWCRNNSKLDLWFFHKVGDYYESFPKSTPGLKFVEKAIWYDEPQIVDFLGDKYPIPNYVEDFVSAHYGPDWRTNIIKDHGKYFREKRGDPNHPNSWLDNRRRKDGELWWPALLKTNENIGDLYEI